MMRTYKLWKPGAGAVPGFPARVLAVALSLALVLPGSAVMAGKAWAVDLEAGPNPAAPFSLKTVKVIEPPNLADFLNPGEPNAKEYAIALGKALLWDVNLGSDGATGCATCHFKAGADNRTKNTLNPGFNRLFSVPNAPNSTLAGTQFPFHQRQNPDLQASPVIRDSDDIVGSQGVRLRDFDGIVLGQGEENFKTPEPVDPVFRIGGVNTRQVTGRNAPTYINAAFNFTNFWDGRAHNVFNGVNPFGPLDDNARVFVDGAGGLVQDQVRIPFAALASQATGPPLNTVEMSYRGRTYPDIGKKMLSLKPLAKQKVHANDSMFGVDPGSLPPNPFTPFFLGLADSPTGLKNTITPGENLYVTLIKKAFHPRFWQNTSKKITFSATGVPTIVDNPPAPGDPVVEWGGAPTNEFLQMEANFSLFLGLAIQLYEATLISDDSKFDQFQEGQAVYTEKEAFGLEIFVSMGCGACHAGSEFAGNTQIEIQGFAPINQLPTGAIGAEFQPRFRFSFVDEGIYNIGVRPTREDLGRGANSPFPNVLNRNRPLPLAYTLLARLNLQGRLPLGLQDFVPGLPLEAQTVRRTDMVQGAFKVGTLRNSELLGPYFHNGSVGTLAQVIDFYTRGGNFPRKNAKNLHPAIIEIFRLQNPPAGLPFDLAHSMVAFLLTLTDERVKQEAAPFDHPEIKVPAGQDGGGDILETRPAVGVKGRTAEGLGPLERFLDLDPFAVGN